MKRLNTRSWLTWANGLTLLRILLVGPIFKTIAHSGAAALILMTIAVVTDIADGMIARRTGTATRIGALFDPAADGILVFTLQIQLMTAGRWPVYLVAASVISFTVFALLHAWTGRGPRSRAGKYVGAAVMGAILLYLVCLSTVPELWGVIARIGCPVVAAYAMASVFENIRGALNVPGGVHDPS